MVCLIQEYVCGEKGISCSWGRAINVANRYVYVTQPEKDRVLVISKIQMVVVDVSIKNNLLFIKSILFLSFKAPEYMTLYCLIRK